MTRRGNWLVLGALALSPLMAASVLYGRVEFGRRFANLTAAVIGATPEPPHLHFRLSQGKTPKAVVEATTSADVTPLSSADADKVLARLKPIGAPADDTQGFALRESALPPPTGATIPTTFPPAPTEGAAPTVDSGPLTVRRVTPEGDVSLADRVAITFSQPMVPVASQEEAARNVPVTLTPKGAPASWTLTMHPPSKSLAPNAVAVAQLTDGDSGLHSIAVDAAVRVPTPQR